MGMLTTFSSYLAEKHKSSTAYTAYIQDAVDMPGSPLAQAQQKRQRHDQQIFKRCGKLATSFKLQNQTTKKTNISESNYTVHIRSLGGS